MPAERRQDSDQSTLFDVDGRSSRVFPELDPPDIAPLKPTAAYNSYWRFAAERQRVFFTRIQGRQPPWSDDEIINKYKFTNAYRASDRVSQYLIRRVIYRNDLPSTTVETFFRVILFKFFNKIETWELLEEALGAITWEGYEFRKFDAVLSDAMASGRRIYSAAYIMPSAGAMGHDRKHSNHLALLERMMRDGLPEKIAAAADMQDGFELLLAYPSVGDFLAYQFITDINYSELTRFSETEFVVPGPGALDGISKCFADTAGLNAPEIIRFMTDRQEAEFARLGLRFDSLWGRQLQLIDCQNVFCELSKYARLRHPELVGISGRTRIKQKFRPSKEPIVYWYPPKWGLNDKITGR
jgi:alpha-glutamyl/putrescinyl thymine pyrophosphorylase clade 1